MSAALPPAASNPSDALHLKAAQLTAYGLFGLPLALVALPIFVYVPKFYNDAFGLSLDLIAALLLGARLLDAISDPLFGWWVDRGHAGVGRMAGYRRYIVLALPLLGFGYVGLFHPVPVRGLEQGAIGAWLAGALIIVYAGFSLATIAYQSWGAELSTDPIERTRITGVREACGLIGVIAAAAVPQVLGMTVLSGMFVVTLLGSAALLVMAAPYPVSAPRAPLQRAGIFQTFRVPVSVMRFRWLLAIFLANGIASAIPATLIEFYIRDVLQLESKTGLFLVLYFLAGACSMPLWVALARRWGQARAWLAGMVANVLAFMWVYGFGPGDFYGYAAVCVISGLTLGADLALPGAILAGVIADAGHRGTREGAYFGIWSFCTKLNLALAAGISLPLATWLGYLPSRVDASGMRALSICYALAPCMLKFVAIALLWRSPFFKEKK